VRERSRIKAKTGGSENLTHTITLGTTEEGEWGLVWEKTKKEDL
jgi:hypothetical protein